MKIIKNVRPTHGCLGEILKDCELREAGGNDPLCPGSIVECSCSRQYELRPNQQGHPEWTATGWLTPAVAEVHDEASRREDA